jgi:hypothetical protein
MNFSTVDLDIDNYDDEDLETFFNIGRSYTESDIVSKERIMRDKLMGSITDKSFQNKLFIFLDEAKRLLIQKLKKNPLLRGDGSNFVIDKPQESITNFIQPVNTFPTETTPGVLNRLRRRTRIVSLAMNTVFRDSNSVSSTDCVFLLSYTLKNVVSIRLLSVEIPESIYLISSGIPSNWLNIWVPVANIEGNIFIPDGCYNAISLQTVLQNTINNTLGVNYFSVVIDPVSNKTIISTTNNFEFDITFYNPELNNSKFDQSLGWILGYRKKFYPNMESLVSEGLCSFIPVDYLFFALNDYQIYNSSNLIAMFSENYIDKNILAKIPYSNSNFQVLFDGSEDVLSPKRQYFGPVDIKKMGIQILNKYGQIVDLNFMDFSFTLEVEMIYDI